MRIALVNPLYGPKPGLNEHGRYRHVEAIAGALARGHDVVVIQAGPEDGVESVGGVEFRCVRTPQRSAVRLSGGAVGIYLLSRNGQQRILEAVSGARPQAVHMNGLTLLVPLAAIGAWCEKSAIPLTVSYHGGAPRRAPWLHKAQRRMLARCRAAFFPLARYAQPWLDSGLLKPEQVIACPEVSSVFAGAKRASARGRTGMIGRPVFAWNGRLHALKDPMTALRGFAAIRKTWPDARLYMIYLTNEIESDVRTAMMADPSLQGAVELRGRIPHGAVEDFLNSADFLLQTSRQEIGSYALLEAMSCGVIPVVSDIPIHRAMTDEGRCGILFPVGDHASLAERVLGFDLADIESFSARVREHFAADWSYDRVAEIYETAFAAARRR
jgi:glycosyltransferase involved in cell wall biosynthesis